MKFSYFVHDLSDPAVSRRLRAFEAGGATSVVLGFRRSAEPPERIAGVQAFDLGRTYDARLAHRALVALVNVLTAWKWRGVLAGSDVVVARTLEALAVAASARFFRGSRARLVYECLDIHRAMLGAGLKSRLLRAIERFLLRQCHLLIVSSPAFLTNYFEAYQGLNRQIATPAIVVENKVLELEDAPERRPSPPSGAPWRIGWFGALRCRKSLDILSAVAARRPDLLQVAIHGRPAYGEFADFDAQVSAAPNVVFGGPYAAGDLVRLYSDVHFSWAIDFMEEGQNSSWLLPNRIYEGSRYGAVPIALEGVETGRYLARHGFGIRLRSAEELEGFLADLTAAAYAGFKRELDAVPQAAFVADRAECRQLVETMARAGTRG